MFSSIFMLFFKDSFLMNFFSAFYFLKNSLFFWNFFHFFLEFFLFFFIHFSAGRRQIYVRRGLQKSTIRDNIDPRPQSTQHHPSQGRRARRTAGRLERPRGRYVRSDICYTTGGCESMWIFLCFFLVLFWFVYRSCCSWRRRFRVCPTRGAAALHQRGPHQRQVALRGGGLCQGLFDYSQDAGRKRGLWHAGRDGEAAGGISRVQEGGGSGLRYR